MTVLRDSQLSLIGSELYFTGDDPTRSFRFRPESSGLLHLETEDSTGSFSKMFSFDGENFLIGVFQSSPSYPLDVNGDSRITGNLTATGLIAGSGAAISSSTIPLSSLSNIATDTILGRSIAGTGAVGVITCTAAGRALIDDANAAAQRTTLGLGSMSTQAANAVAITGGTASFTNACSMTSTGTTLYIESSNTSFSGDVLQVLGNTTAGNSYYGVRVYNNLGSPVGGIRGDGAVIAGVMSYAPNYVVGQVNKGLVGASVSFDWRQGSYQTMLLTSATPCTVTFSNAPNGPGMMWLKVTAPAAGTSPAITWPAVFKNNPPTSVPTLGNSSLFPIFYDGAGNYLYLSGSLNFA